MPEYWIQIENHAWDVMPNNVDRMTGKAAANTVSPPSLPVSQTLHSPVTNHSATHTMYRPLSGDALILRRYTENWAAPIDHKVNPWDINERDPGENGTMGTIPGPVIEASIGESVTVHFRNADSRAGFSDLQRCHSLHPHGFVFAPTSDGAYPLSPPDPSQAVSGEGARWAAIGVTNFKQGDRVPPPDLAAGGFGGTFTYAWETHSWPTTAGVWLYHDHSVKDMDNVAAGAIGIVVIHNPHDPAKPASGGDPDDIPIRPEDLPNGDPAGNPVETHCFPFPFKARVLPGQLELLVDRGLPPQPPPGPDPGPEAPGPMTGMAGMPIAGGSPELDHLPIEERLLDLGNFQLELDAELLGIHRFCISRYRTPPARAQYLLLFHEMAGVGVCINGRKFIGNTPTLVAGPRTHMRFGAVAMGSMFHTFHLHGHRWVLPGPEGDDIGAIQSSPQVKAVSQFEDTRTFGPANSFVFAIDEGQNFMRAKPEAPSPHGEWHLHCHVLDHMMDGMMGSLLIIDGGELTFGLPQGTDPDGSAAVPPPSTNPTHATIDMKLDAANPSGFSFAPAIGVTVAPGAAITFHHVDGADPHQIAWDTPVPASRPHPANSGVSSGDIGPLAMPTQTGTYPYHCGIHGAAMNGSITVA